METSITDTGLALRVNGSLLAVGRRPRLVELEAPLRGIALSDSPVLLRADTQDGGWIIQRLHALGVRPDRGALDGPGLRVPTDEGRVVDHVAGIGEGAFDDDEGAVGRRAHVQGDGDLDPLVGSVVAVGEDALPGAVHRREGGGWIEGVVLGERGRAQNRRREHGGDQSSHGSMSFVVRPARYPGRVYAPAYISDQENLLL